VPVTDTTNHSLHADVLVIGFGKGGRTAAAALGTLGRRVVLVERSERMYGGTCPNVGCIPSKGMVHRSGARRATDPPQAYYERAVAAVQAVREKMRVDSFEALDGIETVTVLTGEAAFIDPHTVGVGLQSGRVTIAAETILINTGSEPVVPDIPGLRESPRTVTSTQLLETTVLPERLAILGAGYVGVEFAAIYRRFGSQVTLLSRSSRFLPGEDADVAATAERILADEGITILKQARVVEVRDGTVVYEQDGRRRTLEVDTILAATGRAPAITSLDLEAAGVRTSERGAIEVDDHLRTSQPHIYAVGNVNGGPQHTYISLDDSRIVLEQLRGVDRRSASGRVAVPRTLFMTPPLASVGITEEQAREAGFRVRIASRAVAEIAAMPRAYAVEETRGMMKFVIDAETDEILGAALLCIDAQELINTVALAMRHGITAGELGDAIYSHPSSTEAFNGVLAAPVLAHHAH
jgi:pyruvate/2-oxoglutarate dehydrogenase complex dihydrolipoamide dehydrogenase (E3) component